MVALAMVLALSVAGTASGEDMPAGTSAAETAVKSAGKTGEITFPAGSYIVDMGNTSSDDAQLKPYGLIYDLVLNAKVPVYWVINGSKTSQTGVDLTYNGKDYISGPFVISGDDVDYNVRSMLSKWSGYGVSIDGPTDTTVTVDDSRKISSVPRVVLDEKNGKIAKGYLVKSGILRNENATDDRVYKEKATPADLESSCDDIYVMPHAEPTTATHGPLASFNKGGGYIWAGCHAVSYLESDDSKKGVTDRSMFFLSTNGLLLGDNHKGASGKSDAYQVTGTRRTRSCSSLGTRSPRTPTERKRSTCPPTAARGALPPGYWRPTRTSRKSSPVCLPARPRSWPWAPDTATTATAWSCTRPDTNSNPEKTPTTPATPYERS